MAGGFAVKGSGFPKIVLEENRVCHVVIVRIGKRIKLSIPSSPTMNLERAVTGSAAGGCLQHGKI